MLRSGIGCRLCSSRSGAGAPVAAELGLLLASIDLVACPVSVWLCPFLSAVALVSEWPERLQWCCQIFNCRNSTRHSYLCMSGMAV